MALTYSARLRKAILNRRAKPFQQFGQTGDYTTFGGATGCTHTVLQWLIWIWKHRWVTHDEISHVAGYPTPPNNPRRRGLYPAEVMRVVRAYGLPYTVKLGLTANQVLTIAKSKGPVGFGHAYPWWPEWKGYRYAGITADGKPNGYARVYGKAGRTQLSGFTGAHFGVVLGVATDPTGPDWVYAWEPNHDSGARPERPPYDRMDVAQFGRTYDSYRKVLGRTPYALIPTEKLPL